MSDQQAYASWTDFYLRAKGLGGYLGQSAAQRGYKWMSVCVFAFCPQYAYDMGSDAVLLERNVDEVSGLSPGLAMVRGAARQHGGKEWGVDLSTWRYWNDGPTQFDASGPAGQRLVAEHVQAAPVRLLHGRRQPDPQRGRRLHHRGGRRGAEPAGPHGAGVRRLRRCAATPTAGPPTCRWPSCRSTRRASSRSSASGCRLAWKWYWKNPYTAGDSMLASTLELAFPGYGSWGTIPAGAPWKVLNADGSINVAASQAAYRQALAGGADPRRWEPTGSSRWGETIDVVTDRAGVDALAGYRIVMLSTGQPVSRGPAGHAHPVRPAGRHPGDQRQAGPRGRRGADRGDADRRAAGRPTPPSGWPTAARPATAPTTTRSSPRRRPAVLARTPSGDPLVTRNQRRRRRGLPDHPRLPAGHQADPDPRPSATS